MSEQMKFGRIDIAFDEHVLRPRQWTLAQADWAAELLGGRSHGRVLELCSGAGHIGLSLGLLVPQELVLVDIDPHACAFASANARSAGIWHRVEIRTSPVEAALQEGETFAVILADPPWVRSAETGRFPEDPLLAIDGGDDGMALARVCLDVIDRHLETDGAAILQLGTLSQALLLQNHLVQNSHLDLVVGEVREFGSDGVLVRMDRPGAAEFRDCRGEWHSADSPRRAETVC